MYMLSYCRVTGMAADGALVGRAGNGINEPYIKSGFVALHPETVYGTTDPDTGMYDVCDTHHTGHEQLGLTWCVARCGGQGLAAGRAQGRGGRLQPALQHQHLGFSAGAHWSRWSGATRAQLSLQRLNDDRKGAATAYDLAYCGYRWMVPEHQRAMVFDAVKRTYRNLGPGLYGQGGQSDRICHQRGRQADCGHVPAAGGSGPVRSPAPPRLFNLGLARWPCHTR